MATKTLLTVEDFMRLPESVGGREVCYQPQSREPR